MKANPRPIVVTVEDPPPLHPGEAAFFYGPGILVTDSRLVFSGKTFVLANVTSVESIRVKPNDSGNGLLMLVGVGAVITGAFTLKASVLGGIAVIVIGAALVTVVQIAINRRKPRFALIVETNSGKQTLLESEDADVIAQIATAVNDAIAAGRRVRPDRM